MKRILLFGILIATLLALGACAPAATPGSRQSLSTSGPAQPPMPAATVAPKAPGVAGGGAANQGSAESDSVPGQAPTQQMIVYTVYLSLQVDDAEKTLDKMRQVIAQTQGGYVSAANFSRTTNDKVRGTATLRIPAAALDSSLTQFKAMALKVLSEKRDSSDVTDQYVDLDARRRNLEATEQELLKLLDTVRERSNKAEDILAVYRELTNVRAQIEQIKGRQNVLSNTSALATVTVELVPFEPVQITDPEQWMPNQTAAAALRQLVRALQGLADAGITIGLLVVPLLIVMALPFVLLFLAVRWFVRRNRRTPKPKQAAA